MTAVNTLWRLVAALLLFAAGVSCSTHSGSRETKSDKVDRIARTLQACPTWTQVSEQDVRERQRITDVYLHVAQYDTSTIRNAVAEYVNRVPISSPQHIEAGDKIFALLRVVFKVPPFFDVQKERLSFSLHGNPVQEKGVNLLWPFSMDPNDRLLLTGVDPGAYSGLSYDPLRDFDQMALKLERRFPVSR